MIYKYILEDLDYIFVRAKNAQGKWDNLSLNELTNDQWEEWLADKLNCVFQGKPHIYTKEEKVAALILLSADGYNPVMIKRDKRKEFNQS